MFVQKENKDNVVYCAYDDNDNMLAMENSLKALAISLHKDERTIRQAYRYHKNHPKSKHKRQYTIYKINV